MYDYRRGNYDRPNCIPCHLRLCVSARDRRFVVSQHSQYPDLLSSAILRIILPHMRSGNLAIVQTTVASRKAARRLARLIVRARLAACVQVLPIHSTYRWQNRVCQTAEWLLMAKTHRARATALMAFIRDHHPYELPEIVALNIAQVLPAYRQWVLRETKAPS